MLMRYPFIPCPLRYLVQRLSTHNLENAKEGWMEIVNGKLQRISNSSI